MDSIKKGVEASGQDKRVLDDFIVYDKLWIIHTVMFAVIVDQIT